MISDLEIEEKARELDVSPQDVERDYVHGWLLKEIYNASLGNNPLSFALSNQEEIPSVENLGKHKT
jgi:hypothetical protein